MYVKYGDYQFADNSVGFHLDYRIKHDGFRRERGNLQTWILTGRLKAAGPALLTPLMIALENAFNDGDKDLIFYDDNDAATRHSVLTASTISGTRVVDFRWLGGIRGAWDMGVEYATLRSFRIVIQADTHADIGLLEWRESVRLIGDGLGDTLWMPSLQGVPQPQVPQTFDTHVLIQSGYAVGDQSLGWPATSPALYGRGYLKSRDSYVDYSGPEDIMRNGSDRYVTRWRYVFEADVALGGFPFIPDV